MGHQIDGIINLNKPSGKTSFQMVALVRKLTGVRKVGHSGTLDPDATGVLPILIGRATRLAPFLTDTAKIYRAEIQFGRATTTYDSSGDTTAQADASSLTLDMIESGLKQFCGDIEQIPPMYSAIKHKGKPLYRLARAGMEVVREPRKITIFRIEILQWQIPCLTVEVECGKGTYIRSLAHDLGQMLGCGAHLAGLIRIQTGPFRVEKSISTDELESGFESNSWRDFIHSPDIALENLVAIKVDESGEQNISCGQPVKYISDFDTPDGGLGRAYSEDGRFLALIRYEEEQDLWYPKRVFI